MFSKSQNHSETQPNCQSPLQNEITVQMIKNYAKTDINLYFIFFPGLQIFNKKISPLETFRGRSFSIYNF